MASAPPDRVTPSPLSDLDSPTIPPPAHHHALIPEVHGAHDDGTHAVMAADTAQPSGTVERDDASSTDMVNEKTPKETLTKRQKMKRHCGRFKWWYLVGVIIFLAIFLPLLFKVIIPAIIQRIVNDQSLPITSGTFRASTPDELIVSISTELDSPLGVDIGTTDLYLSRSGEDGEEYESFVMIQLPESHVDGRTELAVTNQTVVIDNEDELVTWFTDVFNKKTVALDVWAKPKVELGALDYTPTLSKTLEVPALNALEGFGVQDLRFSFSGNDSDSANSSGNLSGKTNLPNAGSLTLGLGNITFNIYSGEIRMGLLTVYNVDLTPGDNLLDFEGEIFFSELVPNLLPILDSQKGALARGVIELHATGNATVVNGVHIPYVERVLKDKRIAFEISIMTLLVDVLGGITSGGEGSLLEVFGDVFGNSTLLEGALDHWGVAEDNENEKRDVASLHTKLRRTAPRASLVWSMMKLGNRNKK